MRNGHLLTAGGIDDQPLGRWREAEFAGYVDDLLRRIAAPEMEWGAVVLDPAEADLLARIAALRERSGR